MSFHLPLDPPDHKDVVGRRLRLVAGRGGAEVAAIAASFGLLAGAEKLTPKKLAELKAYAATHIIAPNLSTFDKLADKMPGFEGSEGAAARRAMPPEERAKYYADGLVDYSIMAGGSFAGQMVAQEAFDHLMGLKLSGSSLEKMGKMFVAAGADRGVQIGSMLLLTAVTPGLAEKLQHFTARHVMKFFGVTDEKAAEEKARALVTLHLPNLMGWAGSIGFLDGVYAKELASTQQHLPSPK